MGNSDSIDFSLSSLYKSWYAFRSGKRASSDIVSFQFYLESHLRQLTHELTNKTYQHGGYAYFVIEDTKRRDIAVAPVKERIVHRLLYDYLLNRWDKTFIYDAWSCRNNKGQHKAIERAASFVASYANGWVWRADITKFFDSVDQEMLLRCIKQRVRNPDALWLIREVLSSYSKNELGRGMPIGNLTSQIFANIYLNEFDRFMIHTLKPRAYLRYGDDWLCFTENRSELIAIRDAARQFLSEVLKLSVSQKLDIITPAAKGVTYLGIDLWPGNQRITKTTRLRIDKKITSTNYYSYEALIRHFSNERSIKKFYWQTLDI
jgi:RNA-directed DNA polymerase